MIHKLWVPMARYFQRDLSRTEYTHTYIHTHINIDGYYWQYVYCVHLKIILTMRDLFTLLRICLSEVAGTELLRRKLSAKESLDAVGSVNRETWA